MESAARADRLSLGDWLTAETVRRAEERSGRVDLDHPATQAARALEGDVRSRIVHRARALAAESGLSRDVRRTLSVLGWVYRGVALAGLLAGIAAARAVLGQGPVIPLSWVLVTLLGVPTLLLVVWMILAWWPASRNPSPGLPGRLAGWLAGVLAARGFRRRHREDLLAALAGYTRLHGRALAALVTHGFWSLFFVAAIATLATGFLALRFDFAWGTTLLSTAPIEGLIRALSWLPALIPGVDLPGPEQVAMLLEGGTGAGVRALWARWLLGVIAVYGLLPRLVLVAVYAAVHARRRQGLVLDLGRPGYLRLLPVLAGDSRRLGKKGAAPPSTDSRPLRHGTGGDGPPVLVGLELERGEEDWPPSLPDPEWRVLGRAEDRAGFANLLDALDHVQPPPRRILALCSMARTPDRGIVRWLGELERVAPVTVLLDEASLFAARGGEVDRRRDDWARLLAEAGLEPPQDWQEAGQGA